MITTPALAAAFRLATSLPRRVHPRREQETVDQPCGGYGSLAETRARRALIRKWWRAGDTTAVMADRLRISRRAVQLHLKALRAEGRHRD